MSLTRVPLASGRRAWNAWTGALSVTVDRAVSMSPWMGMSPPGT